MKKRVVGALLILCLSVTMLSGCRGGETERSEEPLESSSTAEESSAPPEESSEPVDDDEQAEIDQYIGYYTGMFSNQYATPGQWMAPGELPQQDKALVAVMNLMRIRTEDGEQYSRDVEERLILPASEVETEVQRLFGPDELVDFSALQPPMRYSDPDATVRYIDAHGYGDMLSRERETLADGQTIEIRDTLFDPDDAAQETPFWSFRYRFERAQREDGRPYLRFQQYRLEEIFQGNNEAIDQQGLGEAMTDETLAAVKIFYSDPALTDTQLPYVLEELEFGERGQWLLVMPRDAQTQVLVEQLRFDEAASAFVPDGALLDTVSGKSWGLLIRMDLPEATQTLRVTMRRDNGEVVYTPQYDGRGDTVYPVVKDGVLLDQERDAPFRFREGPDGAEVTGLDVGDAFLGFTLERVERFSLEDHMLFADFSGEAVLRGELYVAAQYDGPMSGAISFYPDAESAARLPYWEHDERIPWMMLDNEGEIKALTGEGEKRYVGCELHIQDYHYSVAQMMTANSTHVVEVFSLGKEAPVEREEGSE